MRARWPSAWLGFEYVPFMTDEIFEGDEIRRVEGTMCIGGTFPESRCLGVFIPLEDLAPLTPSAAAFLSLARRRA